MTAQESIHSLVAVAERIARRAHVGQFRRDGVTPYIVHPEAVVSRVRTDEEKAVAWLHDVIEDTEMDAAKLLKAGITEAVVDAVVILTKTADTSYEDYLTGVKENPLAQKVKIADMLSNLADYPSDKQIVKYAKGLLFLHS